MPRILPCLWPSVQNHASDGMVALTDCCCCRLGLPEHHPQQRVREYPFQDDAFSTIMQWLYTKVPETR